MKAVLKSLATVVLAATIPVLVFGSPRGGVTCTIALLDTIQNCETTDIGDCVEAGDDSCTYDVLYVNNSGNVVHGTATGQGTTITVENCRSIQCKHCKMCSDGLNCQPDDSPCF